MNIKEIAINKVTKTEDGVRMNFNPKKDLRRTTKLLLRNKIPYHTYTMDEEKIAQVAIKGTPEYITEEIISAEKQHNRSNSHENGLNHKDGKMYQYTNGHGNHTTEADSGKHEDIPGTHKVKIETQRLRKHIDCQRSN